MQSKIEEAEEGLRNPKPGTAAAAAAEFGIDLTLVISQLRLTPEERIRRLDSSIEAFLAIHKSALNSSNESG